MAYQIRIEEVSEQPVAAVRVAVAPSQVSQVCLQHLDKVWKFLRGQEVVQTNGHNVFIYRCNPADANTNQLVADFGVQVMADFADGGEIICTSTPAGRVATTTHVGPYGQLSGAHEAVTKWCSENGHVVSGVSWELYGHWNEDPTKLETHVSYLLG